MTDTQVRKYAIGDEVETMAWSGMSTIVGFIGDDFDREAWGIDAPGPLYRVNEGNVFSEAYEAIYPESQLRPYGQPEDDCTPF